jgi:hypothetical protein
MGKSKLEMRWLSYHPSAAVEADTIATQYDKMEICGDMTWL